MMTITLYLRENINWEQMWEMSQDMLDKYGSPRPCEQCGSDKALVLYRKKAYEGPWLCFECNWKKEKEEEEKKLEDAYKAMKGDNLKNEF